MVCPLRRRCYFYRVSQRRREMMCDKEDGYKQCIYYRICKDFKNPYDCTRAIYLYESTLRDVWW